MREFAFENKGAGLYGAPAPTHKTRCPNSNNPFGHSTECPRCVKPASPLTESAEVIEFPGSRHNALFDPPEAA